MGKRAIGRGLVAGALLFSSVVSSAAVRPGSYVASSTAAVTNHSGTVASSSTQSADTSGALGTLTVLGIVAVVIGGFVLLLDGDDDDDIRLPTSRG